MSNLLDWRINTAWIRDFCDIIAIVTYNDRTVTHLHIKWGVALGAIVVGAGTRHFPPFPDTRPRNQTYATVVFGEGRVSGEQMLTVGRGLWTTATAAVGPQCWAMQGACLRYWQPAKVHKAAGAISHRSSRLTANTSLSLSSC